ncbi:MAG: lmo0937 family membrane protein, partial [Methylicorpusculum sp.]|nr:lmo0937 family membrane protein [Methylicorpusculum sp.]
PFGCNGSSNAVNRRLFRENDMLINLAIILVVLWVLGLVSSYTLGGFIHILLVIALIVVVLNIIQGRRAL